MPTYQVDELLAGLNEFELKNAPETLYLSGDADLLRTGRRVSIVGSRSASALGKQRTRILAKALVERGIVVVSGLARGIDTVAHIAAIEFGGRTAAVLGTSLDKSYPSENRDLQREIMNNHVAVSQFASGSDIQRRNFPMRNRLMALLSDATVIVEASENSGTRHQGWEALRLGRDVFLMSNVVDDSRLTWPSEMMKYGAHVLSRDIMDQVLDALPSYTNRANISSLAF